MDSVIYFQFDFEGQRTTSAGDFREGYVRRTVFVEIGGAAFDASIDSGSKDEAAEGMARTVAVELAAEELAELDDEDGVVTRIEQLPSVIQESEPDVDDPGVRAWLVSSR
jgi:hypothetical protein